MARSGIIPLLAAMAVLAACGTKAETTAAGTPAFASGWHAVSGESAPSLPRMIEIHRTRYGFEGHIWRDGRLEPIRNVVIAGSSMSFIVPALDTSWSGKAGPAQTWAGRWTARGDAASGTLAAGSAPDLQGRVFVTLKDGRQMFLDCRGEGAPVVVFDAGLGGTVRAWRMVHDQIAKTTRACAYDRAGHGLSDPRPLPLDAAAVADDLDAMLVAAHVPAPYVLVGHSLGSYHVRQYANTRFGKMAGMVLVDPSGDNQQARIAAVIPEAAARMITPQNAAAGAGCAAKLRERLVLSDEPLARTCGINDAEVWEQTESERDAMTGSSLKALTQSKRSWNAMPLIVLTRGDYRKGMPAEFTDSEIDGFKSVWFGMHEEMVKLSSAGEHRTVPGAGHMIPFDQPQAVIEAVNDVVARARANAAKR